MSDFQLGNKRFIVTAASGAWYCWQVSHIIVDRILVHIIRNGFGMEYTYLLYIYVFSVQFIVSLAAIKSQCKSDRARICCDAATISIDCRI